jgi:MYXO-CTERM domain-containing protein
VSTWAVSLVLAAAGLEGLREAPRPPTPIVGGEAVEGRGWSNVVAVLSVDPSQINTGHLCSGTLIAPQIVLTAGHCIVPETDPDEIAVYFGDSIYGKHVASVVRFEIFPEACVEDCDPDAYDFAFLEIREKIGGVDIIPILTDQDEWNETMVVGKPVTFVGFGAIRDDGEEEPPLEMDELGYKAVVAADIVDFSESGREFIAGERGKDTCSGDSGGPAFVQLADGSWRQVGVTSRGVRPCGYGRGYYGVPFFIMTWLRDEAGVPGMPEDCEDYACLDPLATVDEGCGCAATGGEGAWWLLLLLALGWRRRR